MRQRMPSNSSGVNTIWSWSSACSYVTLNRTSERYSVCGGSLWLVPAPVGFMLCLLCIHLQRTSDWKPEEVGDPASSLSPMSLLHSYSAVFWRSHFLLLCCLIFQVKVSLDTLMDSLTSLSVIGDCVAGVELLLKELKTLQEKAQVSQ